MIRPEDIGELQHAQRSRVERLLETKFDAAIATAAETREWPAKAMWMPWPDDLPAASPHEILAVVVRYRDARWHVVTDVPNPGIIATIIRR